VATGYVVAVFINLIDATVVNVALPTIAGAFAVPVGQTATVNLGFLVALAVTVPAAGWLGDRFGTREVFVIALGLFTAASAACGFAGSLGQLVAFRVAQGLAGGLMMPVGMAMMYHTFPPAGRIRVSRIINVPIAFAPAAGPLLGGFLVEHAGRSPSRSRGQASRRSGDKQGARGLTGARYALWKNPGDLTRPQQVKLAWIAAANKPLHRAYELKEAFRKVIRIKGRHGSHLLDDWLAWASRSRLTPFVELARTIRRHRPAIENMLDHNLSNALIESTNTKIRLPMRMAFGFKDTDALIALAMLALGGYRPDLPRRLAA
jgi:MFS family permease